MTPSSVSMKPGIRVWTLDLRALTQNAPESPPAAWLALLDDGERQRCARLRRVADRLSYSAAHALTRRVLADALDLPPQNVRLRADADGKPHLAPPGDDATAFSLSHCDGMAALAVSTAGPVGVDVESTARPNGDDGLSAYALPAAEAARIAARPAEQRNDAFIDAWTACEAVAKGDGRGLSLPFAAISFDRDGLGALVESPPKVPQRWRLWRHRPSPTHRLAVAWPENPAMSVHYTPVPLRRDNGYSLNAGSRDGDTP